MARKRYKSVILKPFLHIMPVTMVLKQPRLPLEFPGLWSSSSLQAALRFCPANPDFTSRKSLRSKKISEIKC